jgi:protein-histidine pros-kinase
MGLRAKFNIAMFATLLIGVAVAALLARGIAESAVRQQMLQEATMIMRQATALRGYTQGEIEPLLRESSAARFLPHTVPSWAAQTVFRTVQREAGEYGYKEAALNPTNPADRASDWEAAIIAGFRRDGARDEYVGERETPQGRSLVFARPFRLTDRNCLACHSTPDAAPVSMIDLYGRENGFGWQLGDVIGAQVVSVPMHVALERSDRLLFAFLMLLGGIFVAMVLLVNLLLHVVIIRPVQRITAAAETVSAGALDEPEYQLSGRDEIASLSRSFNLMRRSLVNAMKLLGDPPRGHG